jgi:putative peptide zinc metalloprotease protein
VRQDQALIRLTNPELELDLISTRAKYDEILARLRQARKESIPNLKPLNHMLESITNHLQKLETDQRSLVIRARHDGVLVAPRLEDYLGRWISRGTPLGLLVNTKTFEFMATVKQEDADALFGGRFPTAEIRLKGQAGQALPVSRWKVIPAEQQTLPSPVLGWHGGGELQVSPQDPQGRKAAEPFFEVLADVKAAGNVELFDGRSGKIRFDLQPEPLLPRWTRRLLQLFQKRYQL